MIKAVCFDIGGTLLETSKYISIKRILLKMLDVDEDFFYAAYKHHFIEKQNSFQDFCRSVAWEDPIKLQMLLLRYYSEKPLGKLYREAESVLCSLKNQRLYLMALSNKSYFNPHGLKVYGIEHYFDAEIYSYQVGNAKPGTTIFGFAQSLAGVQSHEIIHVGDSMQTDVLGANAAGWYSVHLTRSGKDRVSSTTECPKADYTITELAQLLEVIDTIK